MKSNNKYCIRDNKITMSKTTYEESLGVVIIFFFFISQFFIFSSFLSFVFYNLHILLNESRDLF